MFVLSVQQQTKRSTPGYNSHWAPTYTVWVQTACSLSTYYMCSTMKSARDITKKPHSHWFKSDIRSKTVQECWAIFHGFRLRQYNNGERGTAPNTDNNQTQTTNGVYSQQTECTHNRGNSQQTKSSMDSKQCTHVLWLWITVQNVCLIYILYFKHPLLSSTLWRTHTFHCHWHFLTYGSLWFFMQNKFSFQKRMVSSWWHQNVDHTETTTANDQLTCIQICENITFIIIFSTLMSPEKWIKVTKSSMKRWIEAHL